MKVSSRKTTPAQRAEIHRRNQAGEKASALAIEFGISRQLISQILIRQRKAAESGNLPITRQRRDLNQLIPQKLQALRLLVTTKSPSELGLIRFSGWNDRAARTAMEQFFHFRMMQFEAGHFLAEWGVAAGPPHHGRGRSPNEEVFAQDYYDYINSDIGRQVRERSKLAEARELAEAAARLGSRKGPGRPRKLPAESPPLSPRDAAAAHGYPDAAEIDRRLEAAKALIGDEKVQAVLDHYTNLPTGQLTDSAGLKKRGSNFTPPKKKRRK